MSGNSWDSQNPPVIQKPGITQMCESRDKPLHNTTTDMLSELAEKFHTMKKLQSMIKDFFSLDQTCCMEFLERILEELKTSQNVQASASSSSVAFEAAENQNYIRTENKNASTIGSSHEYIEKVLPSTTRNMKLINENQLSVDEDLHEKMWSLANSISDSVTRALMPDEPPKEIQTNRPLLSRRCYNCRLPGHYVANCPENKKAGNFSEDEFNRVQKSGYDKKYESEGKKYKSPKSEKDFSPPRKKSSLPGRICYVCRLPGHLASMCPEDEKRLKPPRVSRSPLHGADT